MLKIKRKQSSRPLVMLLIDGFGIASDSDANAITRAQTPNFDSLIAQYPAITLSSSINERGITLSKKMNSEQNYRNLGAGRIVDCSLSRIDRKIKDKSFFKETELLNAIKNSKKNNSDFHLLGMLSESTHYSSINHIKALLKLAKKEGLSEVFLHLILDGEDTSKTSGLNTLTTLSQEIASIGIGTIATVMGSSYGMNVSGNWEKTMVAYASLTQSSGSKTNNILQTVQNSYEKNIFDNDIVPIILNDRSRIKNQDSVISFNFRPDRIGNLTKAFVLPCLTCFERKYLNKLYFVSFSEHNKMPLISIFSRDKVDNLLGEMFFKNDLGQIKIAESYKFAHITAFLNTGQERFKGEEQVLVSSDVIDKNEIEPEMQLKKITKIATKEIKNNNYNFILVNFTNPETIAETGNFEATVKAVELVDKYLKKIVTETLNKNGILIITSLYGKAEKVIDMKTGLPEQGITSNPVPFVLIGKEFEGKALGQEAPEDDLSLLKPHGSIIDIAPTILKMFNIEKPPEMAGNSLI